MVHPNAHMRNETSGISSEFSFEEAMGVGVNTTIGIGVGVAVGKVALVGVTVLSAGEKSILGLGTNQIKMAKQSARIPVIAPTAAQIG